MKVLSSSLAMDVRLTTIVAAFFPECLLVGRDEVSVPEDEVALEE
jgi:hypothetical protein